MNTAPSKPGKESGYPIISEIDPSTQRDNCMENQQKSLGNTLVP